MPAISDCAFVIPSAAIYDELERIRPVRIYRRVRAQRDLHAQRERALHHGVLLFDGAVRLGLHQRAGISIRPGRPAWSASAPGTRRDRASCAGFVVEESAVLDRIDARADGALGRLRSVRVRRGLRAQRVRFVHQRVQFRLLNCGTSTSSVGESTPPLAQVLITSAPYLMLKRTA